MRKKSLLVLINLFVINLYAQTFQWTKREGSWAFDLGYGVTTDTSGNVYLAGKYELNANFSDTVLPCQGNHDIFVAKYTPYGKLTWVRSAGGYSGDYARAIACDGKNYIYVTGEIQGDGAIIKFVGSPVTLNTLGNNDVFLAKYDLNGNLLWAKSAGGPKSDEGMGVTYDAAGNVYICGFFNDKITFGNTILTSSGGYDMFIAKYDSNGNFKWAKKTGGAGKDEARSIKYDAAGNLYVCGGFTGRVTFGNKTIHALGGMDGFLAKYDSNGSILWVKSVGGSGNDEVWSLTMDNAGKIYVTGEFSSNSAFGGISLTSAGQADIFVACYNASGNRLWAKRAGGTGLDRARGIGSDGTNLYITGQIGSTNASFGSTTLHAGDISDVFMAKLDNAGNFKWATAAGGPKDSTEIYGFESGIAICAEASGNVYATGAILEGGVFGNITINKYDKSDVFLAKIQDTVTTSLCKIPTGLFADSITGTSAILRWAAVNNALSYNVQYRKKGTDSSWTNLNVTINSIALSGLTASTNYEFQVKTICSANINNYSQALPFTTTGTGSSGIISAGSLWKYLDNGTNQGTVWRMPVYNDSTWKTGKAEFGYGEGDESTVLGFGPDATNKYITTYFRKNVTIDLLSNYSSFELKLLKDDGAIVYINGVEALRANMPAGTVTSSTVAVTAISGTQETTFTSYILDPPTFVTGVNTIAVEVHQNYSGSPDLSFNLMLNANSSSVAVCEIPTNLNDSTTSNSATLNWTAVSGATSYDVQYRNVGTTSWTTLNTATDSIILSGLTASTSYEYQVRTVCSSAWSVYSSLSTFLTSAEAGTTELISAGSSWKFLDDGTNQGTSWNLPVYNDSIWKTGNAEFGYGDGDETTVVNYGSSSTNKYVTTYFRKTFNVADSTAISALELSLIRDDGAVVYINGIEMYRTNLPTGTIYFNTLAPIVMNGVNESAYEIINVGSASLVNGNNLIAVEIHQNAVTSADISFNLKLKASNGFKKVETLHFFENSQTNSIEGSYDMIVSPNPTTGKFNLEFCIDNLMEKIVAIEVSNTLGQTVYKKQPKKINGCVEEVIELDSHLPMGIYILKVLIGDKIETKNMLLAR